MSPPFCVFARLRRSSTAMGRPQAQLTVLTAGQAAPTRSMGAVYRSYHLYSIAQKNLKQHTVICAIHREQAPDRKR